MNKIKEPIKRNKIRRLLGREYYILKRKLHWFTAKKKWASKNDFIDFNNKVFSHKSMILRPLLGVDMQLQRNKKKNLKIAITK